MSGMKTRTILSVALVLSAGALAFSEGDDLLRVEIAPYKSKLLIGEPLCVRMRFRNISNKKFIMVPTDRGLGDVYTSPDGLNFGIYIHSIRSFISRDTFWHQEPGVETVNDRVVAFYRPESSERTRLVFPAAGDYWIYGRYDVAEYRAHNTPAIDVSSAPVKITVMQPVGKELEVWEKLQKLPEYGAMVQWHIADKRPDALMDIVKKYPRSVYSQYLALALGEYFFRLTTEDDERWMRSIGVENGKKEAVWYFRLAAEMKPQYPFRDPVVADYHFLNWRE